MKNLNLKPIFLLIVALMLYTPSKLRSQSFEEFVQQRQAELEQHKESYQQQLNQMRQAFDIFVNQRDHEFQEYLKQQWNEYELFSGMYPQPKPKPNTIPTFESSVTPVLPDMIALPVSPIILDKTPERPVFPTTKKFEPIVFPVKPVSFDFYGNHINLLHDSSMLVTIPPNIDHIAISDLWKELSKTNYNHFLRQISEYRAIMNLNDWGHYRLLKLACDQIYPKSQEGSVIIAWFLMNRSGYRAKVAYDNNTILLLLPSYQDIFQKPYQLFDGIKYYLVEGTATRIHTYSVDFPSASRIMDMQINSPPNLKESSMSKSFQFTYQGEEHLIQLEYCKNTIEFMSDYPNCQLSVYFNSTVSRLAKESLTNEFLPLVSGKPAIEAVDLLLKFTQTAFEYKTDQEQFRYEKFFFVEEVMHFPYSDCEDRAVFFTYLVRELLNLKVIGLEYPGHVAVGVNFVNHPVGEFVKYNNEVYTICDPTYINAPIGISMPGMANQPATIIQLDIDQYEASIIRKLWDSLVSVGGIRAGNRKDVAFDNDGNAFAVGSFKNRLEIGLNQLTSESPEKYAAFLVKFDNSGNADWAVQANSSENVFAYHLVLDVEQNLYISGTFSQSLTIGNTQLTATKNHDIFLAKFSPDGNLVWVSNAGIDTLNPELSYIFMAIFNPDGSRRGTAIFNEDIGFNDYGISFDTDRSIIVSGSSYSNTGLNIKTIAYDQVQEFDLVINLKIENDRLVAEDTNPAIAGLLAAINLIKINNVVIPGVAVQKSLDTYNPDFKNYSPAIYNSISRINFMKNDQGIIIITTDDGKPIQIDYMRINNNSSMKITELTDGNIQLDILSGITVGRAILWYNLNFVRLLRYTGDLLFDYARDNTQRTLNLKNDIIY